MSVVTYDSQSLSIDGRRVWLVSCTLEYALVPRALWLQRIRSAKMAGFNCISTSVPWSMHEPVRGQVSFEGALNLQAFLELLKAHGMYCILKPGPYVGGAFEAGGLPAWLNALPDVKLREANRPFLEGCARWFAAMMKQVRPFQISVDRESPGQGGPVVLVQVEHQWCCNHDAQAANYLAELIRYLREEGCVLPIIETNNCWQEVEGAFSTWQGSEDLTGNMRQFRQVQQSPPVQQFPLLISDLLVADAGDDSASWPVAQAMAAGAQFNLTSLNDATLWAGSLRQLTTFSSQFDQLFAHLDVDQTHASIATEDESHAPSLVHVSGSHGDVIFIFKNAKDRTQSFDVLLPDGQPLTVPAGSDRVTWLVRNVNLAGIATLDHSNLRPLAFINRRMLVMFGPAGSQGVISIDGAHVDVVVPRGAKPAVYDSDDLTLLILNETQAATCCIDNQNVIIGVGGVDTLGETQLARGFEYLIHITPDGKTSHHTCKPVVKTRAASGPRLSAWKSASCDDIVNGTSEEYVEIAAPTSLDALDPTATCGWYRLSMNGTKSALKLGGTNLLAPSWGDSVTVFTDGKSTAQLSKQHTNHKHPFTLKAETEITLLASIHDRFRIGWRLGECKGLAGHLYQVKPVKLGKPIIESLRLPDLASWRGFLADVSYHVHPVMPQWNWIIKPTGRTALIVHIDQLPMRVAVLANGRIVGVYDPKESRGELCITLEVSTHVTNGKNTLTLALMEPDNAAGKIDPRKYMSIYDATRNLTAKASWAFAPCKPPADDAFVDGDQGRKRGIPCWHRATFKVGDEAMPLMLESRGQSEGDCWLNGARLGRLDAKGRLSIDASLLVAGQVNTLTWFDARGSKPQGFHLVPVV